MGSKGTTDAVAAFCEAAVVNDVDGMVATLAPDVELVSPLSGHTVFRGREDLRVLLDAVFGSLRGVHWQDFVGAGSTRAIRGSITPKSRNSMPSPQTEPQAAHGHTLRGCATSTPSNFGSWSRSATWSARSRVGHRLPLT
jgi:SnoaL-like domain